MVKILKQIKQNKKHPQ